MKNQGAIVEMVLEIDLAKHQDFLIGEDHNKVLCTSVLKALYGMLMESILCCKKTWKDVEAEGYQVNPHGIFSSKKY